MCLNTLLVNATISEKDIICYKVYLKYKGRNRLVSPFAYAKIPEFNEEILDKSFLSFSQDLPDTDYRSVSYGFHSFKRLADAVKFMNYYKYDSFIETTKLVRCKIPKDTLYFHGVTNNFIPGYCSNYIVLLKEISSLFK